MAIIFVIGNDAKAQQFVCPDNYNIKTTYVTIGGCVYEITVCYSCEVTTNHRAFHVRLERFVKVDPLCIPAAPFTNNKAIIAEIERQIKDPQFLMYTLCGLTVPPCTSGGDILYFKHNIC